MNGATRGIGKLPEERAGSSASVGRPIPYSIAFFFLFAAYSGAAILGLNWTLVPGAASPVWPAAGIGLAALLLFGKQLWPAIFLGRVVAGLLSAPDQPLVSLFAISAGNALGTWLAAYLIERLSGTARSLQTSREWTVFLAGTILSAFVSAAIGNLVLLVDGSVALDKVAETTTAWMAGSVVGNLIVAPLILTWASVSRSEWPSAKRWQFVAVLGVTLAVSVYIFTGGLQHRAWFVYPVLVWSALALPVAGTAAALFIVAAVGVAGTGFGFGPFGAIPGDGGDGLVLLQMFIAVSVITTLYLAVTASERRAESLLRAAADKLAAREAQLALAIEHAPAAIAMFDRNMRYIAASRRFSLDYGLGERPLIGESHYEIFPTIPDRWRDVHQRTIQTGEAFSSDEDSFEDENGRRVWVRWAIHPWRTDTNAVGGLVLFSEVITEAVEARRALGLRTEELRSLVESAPIGTAFFDREHRYLRINQYLADINGLDAADHVGRRIEDILPSNAEVVAPIIDQVFETGQAIGNFEVSGETPREPGVRRCWLTGFYPVRASGGAIESVGAWVVEITDRKSTEAELRDAQERLALAMSAASCGVWDYDILKDAPTWSPQMYDLYGLDRGEAPPGLTTFTRVIDPDHRERVSAEIETAVDKGGAFSIEFPFRLPDGTMRWVMSTGTVDKSAGEGGIARGLDLDITERKLALERENLLAREVDHRAKNLLAVVQSVVHLTKASTAAELKNGVLGRIQALARAHGLLAKGRWDGVEIEHLMDEEFAPYGGDAKRIGYSGPMVKLNPAAAQSIALVIHELATNAVKYGALSTADGHVDVRWSLADADGDLCIAWIETGAPSIGKPVQTGFGSKIIRTTIERQLRGSVDYDWAADGLRFTARMPLKEVAVIGEF